jgi:hypothetical protein
MRKGGWWPLWISKNRIFSCLLCAGVCLISIWVWIWGWVCRFCLCYCVFTLLVFSFGESDSPVPFLLLIFRSPVLLLACCVTTGRALLFPSPAAHALPRFGPSPIAPLLGVSHSWAVGSPLIPFSSWLLLVTASRIHFSLLACVFLCVIYFPARHPWKSFQLQDFLRPRREFAAPYFGSHPDRQAPLGSSLPAVFGVQLWVLVRVCHGIFLTGQLSVQLPVSACDLLGDLPPRWIFSCKLLPGARLLLVRRILLGSQFVRLAFALVARCSRDCSWQ